MNNKAKKKKLPELNKDEYQKLKNYIEKEQLLPQFNKISSYEDNKTTL